MGADGLSFRVRYGAELRRHPGRLVGAGFASALAPLLLMGAAGAHTVVHTVVGALHPPAPSPSAPTTVPAPDVGTVDAWVSSARAAASTCPGLPPTVLLAIADVETGRGRHTDASVAGAEGPMQFLPGTWAAYGADGDGDGVADVTNPDDALHGAARLLCANGASDPARLRSAVWNYNHSLDYVERVLSMAFGHAGYGAPPSGGA